MILHSLVARSLYMTAAGMLLAGCMTSRVEESKNAATGLSAGESVVILATSYHRGKATEEDFVSCVNDAVQSGDGKVLPEVNLLLHAHD